MPMIVKTYQWYDVKTHKNYKKSLKTAQNFYIILVAYKNTIKTAALLYCFMLLLWTRKLVYWMLKERPTYCSNNNPIKKVWFLFKQLHIHPLKDNKAFVFHKHHSNALKHLRLNHRQGYNELKLNSHHIFVLDSSSFFLSSPT